MEKSIRTQEYEIFLAQLKVARNDAGLNQAELGKRLGQTQSFISKCERGERRIDVVELRAFCHALGVPIDEFIRRVEEAIAREAE